MKMFRVLEIVWLVIGAIGILMTGYFIIAKDNEGAVFFIIFTLIAGGMYSVRKRQRVRYEAKSKTNQ